jgi:predicted metalloprotease with PDZ domain
MPSEDFTRAVTVKRSTKKKSGYVVLENEGEFLVGDVPEKARVNVGDRIVGINGVRVDQMKDEEDANALVNSLRLLVVPADEIEDYDAVKATEESDQVPVAGMAPTNGERVSVLAGGRMTVKTSPFPLLN